LDKGETDGEFCRVMEITVQRNLADADGKPHALVQFIE